MLFSALICFAVALLVGMWRSYCLQLERESRAMTPLTWHKPGVPFFSFLLVAATSTWASFVFASLLGEIVFGASLMFRWIISALFGTTKATNEARWVRGESEKFRNKMKEFSNVPP